jgi:uncharacterized protein YbcI
MATNSARADGNSAAMHISNAIVKITAEYTGRGPQRARTTIDTHAVLVVLQSTLTKGETALAADGQGDVVMRVRRGYQQTMRADYVAAVERVLGRPVLAMLSDQSLNPDIAAEVFILEPENADTA